MGPVIPIEFSDAIALTKSDSTDLTSLSIRGLYVGVTGDVAIVTTKNGSVAVTLKAVPAGTVIHLPIAKFMSTNTTATNVVGFVGR